MPIPFIVTCSMNTNPKSGKLGRILALTFLSFSLIVLTSAAAFGIEKDRIILGTATPGGGFQVYGAVLAEAVNQMDPALNVVARHTKGSRENVPLLEAGHLDIALVQGEVVQAAFSEVNRPPANLKIIAAMYPTAGLFAVRANSSYHTIRELSGQPVVFGARGSGLVILARNILKGMGLDMDKDFRAIYVDRADEGPEMLADGRAAALWGGGVGWPGFVAVSKAKGGARFIGPSQPEIKEILAKHPFLQRMTIPADSYPGQEHPIVSVGSWSFVLARPSFPDELAYRLARALHRAEPIMATRLPQAKETTAKNTAGVVPRLEWIHPGVLRYLRETGLIP
jgi:uncharacterized protein